MSENTKSDRVCGICGKRGTGHNARTCPEKKGGKAARTVRAASTAPVSETTNGSGIDTDYTESVRSFHVSGVHATMVVRATNLQGGKREIATRLTMQEGKAPAIELDQAAVSKFYEMLQWVAQKQTAVVAKMGTPAPAPAPSTPAPQPVQESAQA